MVPHLLRPSLWRGEELEILSINLFLISDKLWNPTLPPSSRWGGGGARGRVSLILVAILLLVTTCLTTNPNPLLPVSVCVQVRQRNVLKDFVTVAGPLGVTHFMIISRSDDFINLRVCRIPHGPTLTFHIKAVSGRGTSLCLLPCMDILYSP